MTHQIHDSSARVVEKCCKRTSDETDWHSRDSEGTGQCLHLSVVLNTHYPDEHYPLLCLRDFY